MTGKKDQIFDSADLCCRYWKIVLIHCLELIAASLRPPLFRGMCKNIHICNKSLLDKTLKHKKPRICKLWHFWFSHTEVDDLPWLRGAVYCQWKFLLQPGSRWDRGRPFGKHCRTGSNPGWLPVWSPKSEAQLSPRSWCWGWSRSSTWRKVQTWKSLLIDLEKITWKYVIKLSQSNCLCVFGHFTKLSQSDCGVSSTQGRRLARAALSQCVSWNWFGMALVMASNRANFDILEK